VYVADVPNSFNSIMYATVQPTSALNLADNLAALDPAAHPLLRQALEQALANLQPTPDSDVVFTDDRAPIEQLTNSIVIQYVLGGEIYELGIGQ
jgi:hypothetical protein